jgi:hypothetical protein
MLQMATFDALAQATPLAAKVESRLSPLHGMNMPPGLQRLFVQARFLLPLLCFSLFLQGLSRFLLCILFAISSLAHDALLLKAHFG